MRILGFSKDWDKLNQSQFTTFRLIRNDKDWQEGEVVQVFFKPRSKNRKYLGTARIIKKELRLVASIDDEEAVEDGFSCGSEMVDWLIDTHRCNMQEEINKLTLTWLTRRPDINSYLATSEKNSYTK